MMSKTLEKLLKSTPPEVEIFVDLYSDLVVRINQILRDKGMTQKDLADGMEKRPSEISKWLSGDHNFTLRSLAKLQAELGEVLLAVPKPKMASVFISLPVHKSKSTLHSSYSPSQKTSETHDWIAAEKPKSIDYGKHAA